MRNAGGNSFELSVQNPSDTVLSNYTVQYVVAEVGIFNNAEHGITLEAVKFQSTVTDDNNSWNGQARACLQSYTSPVVVGQVMSANDARWWSIFWASDGSRINPPGASSLSVGKHLGEDTVVARADETIGFLVIETGSGNIGGLNYTAGVTPDNIRGLVQSTPYRNNVDGQYSSGVVSAVGMDGNNGGWPVLYGLSPLASALIDLGIEEDQVADSERNHTTEQASYFLLQ